MMSDTPVLEPIVLGHNSFFGVDHLSAERGSQRSAQFSDPERIMEIVSVAYSYGATGLMMSTHERAGGVLSLLKKDKALSKEYKVYPLMPYAQKYITKANEVGLLNVVRESLSHSTISDKVKIAWLGSKGIIGRDVTSMLAALIKIELAPFQGLNVPAVFLHDALTDLALGLDLKQIFEFFIYELDRSYKIRAAFATKNFPTLVKKFSEWGLDKPIVLAHFNQIGYQMNPDARACELALKEHQADVMAMSALASGYLNPDEAFRYLGSLNELKSVVIGASSVTHIKETFFSIQQHMVTGQDAQ
jgi:hypothetical protein